MQEKIELLKKIYNIIHDTAKMSGKNPEKIKLIGVSKKKPAEMILEFRKAGLRAFGENYVQEFLEKEEKLRDLDISWHFIGHLQKNKVKYIIDKVFMIHTLDSFELAKEIQKQAEKKNVSKVRVLIQVNIGKEPQKAGIMPENVEKLLKDLKLFDRIEVRGLMSIPPFLPSEELRPFHKKLKELFDKLLQTNLVNPEVFKELSMGMSGDFDVAIEEGATMVRLGTILFGERVY